MWMYHALQAFETDAARDRAARMERRRWQLADEDAGGAWTDVQPRSRLRAGLALPLVVLSRLTGSVSESACSLATRIEGHPA
jgi:hypothetical protein